jgi:nicotinamide mononucleotide (NMN) deamidase PncC
LGSDLAASITCIAGPDADGTSKPVGLTYIGIAGPEGTQCHDFVLGGDRWSNRCEAAARAIQLLIDETHKLVPVIKA